MSRVFGQAPDAFDEICRSAATLLDAGCGLVVRLDDRGDGTVVGSWSQSGERPVRPAGAGLMTADTVLRRALRSGSAARVHSEEQGPVAAAMARLGLRAAVAATINAGGRPWGVLAVGAEDERLLPPAARERIAILAALAALAVENIGMRGLIADHADEQASLRRVATAVAAEIDQGRLVALVAREAATLCGAESGGVLRLQADGTASVVGSWQAHGLESEPDTAVPLDAHSAAAAALASGAPARVVRPGADGDRARCRIAAPVVVEGAVWGAVAVADHDPQVLPPGSERRLAGFAELLALALASADARERIVTEATAAIFGGALDMGTTLRAIADSAKRALRADRATCFVHSEDQSRVAAVYTTESDPRLRRFLELSVGLGPDQMPIWGHLLTLPDPMIVSEDVTRDPAIPPRVARALGASAFLVARLEHVSLVGNSRSEAEQFPFPGGPEAHPGLAARGSSRSEAEQFPFPEGPEGHPGSGRVDGGTTPLLGTLFVTYAAPRPISSRDRLAGRSLAGLAALAIANVRLHARALASLSRAERLAATDDLTGLANQRAFRERLEMEVVRATRTGRPLALVLIDLDHFKRVNDEHGHVVGDRTLARAAAILREQSRRDELMARVGGEEFGWILPEADAAAAVLAAERARRALEEADFPGVGRLTASAGVADIARAGADADQLYRLADAALYDAKNSGRNVVANYSGT